MKKTDEDHTTEIHGFTFLVYIHVLSVETYVTNSLLDVFFQNIGNTKE